MARDQIDMTPCIGVNELVGGWKQAFKLPSELPDRHRHEKTRSSFPAIHRRYERRAIGALLE